MLEPLFNKRLQHRCFPVKFPKILRTPFFTEHFQLLFLCFVFHDNFELTDNFLGYKNHLYPHYMHLLQRFHGWFHFHNLSLLLRYFLLWDELHIERDFYCKLNYLKTISINSRFLILLKLWFQLLVNCYS